MSLVLPSRIRKLELLGNMKRAERIGSVWTKHAGKRCVDNS